MSTCFRPISIIVVLSLLLLAPGLLLAEQGEEKDSDDEPVIVYGETIVVTGSRTEETIADSHVSVYVVTPEKLETTPADNYADLLRGAPGLNIIQLSARDYNFTARGATSTLATSQLALVDGRSIYQDYFGFVMWDLMPVGFDDIKQIEIQRGPGSAVWGANALNGVINVRTKTPRELDGGKVSIGGGELGTFSASARWADAPSDEVSYKISASYFEQDPWERDNMLPDGTPLPAFENTGSKQPKLDVRLDYQPDAEQFWTFQGGIAGTSGMIHTGIGPFDVQDDTKTYFGKVGYDRGSLTSSVDVTVLDGNGLNLLNGLDFDFETTAFHGEVIERRVYGRQVFVFGASARHTLFDLSIAPLEDKRTEFGVFLEDRVILTDQLTLSLGARVDWFDTIGTTFSPRTSLIFKPAPDHSIRVAYNRAYRAPSLVNNYLDTTIFSAVFLEPIGSTFVWPVNAVGNEDLDEAIIDAFEVGYTVNIANRATLTATAYRNRTQDLIDFFPSEHYGPTDPPPGWPLPPMFVPPGAFPKTFTYRNIGEVVDVGVELSAHIELARGVSTSMSYTWQDEPEITNDGDDPLVLGTPPTHQGAVSVTVNQPRWFGSAGITYTGEAFWSDVLDSRFWGTTDAYTLLSGSLGVRLLNNIVVSVSGTNLTDERVKQHVFGDIIGRKVTGELKLNF